MSAPAENHSLYHNLKLGPLTLEGNLVLGPMAGYTDRAFRALCSDAGASMTCTEMVSTEGLVRDSRNTFNLLLVSPLEQAPAIQLFGSEPGTFAQAVRRIPSGRFAAVDINCGCPVPKVVKTGAGAALMTEPPKIAEIIRVVRSETDLPVTVKIRTGWDDRSLTYLQTGELARDAGAAAVCIHCRTRSQFYAGRPDYAAAAKLKAALDIPVIVSGDLFTPVDVKNVLLKTRCDGAMIARGAIGRPYVFSQTIRFLQTGEFTEPALKQKTGLFLRQLELMAADRGELTACREMRKHVPFLLKGIPNSARVRQACSVAETIGSYTQALDSL